MRRLWRRTAFALTALVIATAAIAPAANAASFTTPSVGEAEVDFLQSNSHVFTVDGSDAKCTTGYYAATGKFSSPAISLTVHPQYTDCTVFGFVKGTIETSGCDFVFAVPGTVASDEVAGTLEVSCSEGSLIRIKGGTCEVTIGSQTVTSGINFVNNTGTSPQTMSYEASFELAATKTTDGFLCPLSGTGVATATYAGISLLEAYDGSTQTDLRAE